MAFWQAHLAFRIGMWSRSRNSWRIEQEAIRDSELEIAIAAGAVALLLSAVLIALRRDRLEWICLIVSIVFWGYIFVVSR